MRRPVGVVLTSIVEVLGSLVVLLFSVLMLAMPAILRGTASATPSPQLPPAMAYSFAAVYGIFGVIGFLTAIGLVRLRQWARYSTLIFAGFVLVTAILLLIVFILMPLPAPTSGSRSEPPTATFRAILAAFPLGLGLLSALWLYYFNRSSTKLAFAQATGDPSATAWGMLIDGRKIPVSIVVIAVLNLIGGAFGLVTAFWVPANVFLGFTVVGFGAKLLTLLVAFAGLYVGVGLLRLSNVARLFAIGIGCFHFVNILVLSLMPGTLQNYLAKYSAWMNPSQPAAEFAPVAAFVRAIFAVTLLFQVIMLYFLLTRASSFRIRPNSGIEEVTV
jgi:hypothetical protein